MPMLKFPLVLILLFVNLSAAYNQTIKTVDSLQTAYLTCLDEGKNMTACAKAFYSRVDSLLNITYQKLLLSLNEKDKAIVKKEQADWLLKRDIYFKQTALELQKNNALKKAKKIPANGDNDMMMYDANAGFVKKRLLILLKKLYP
jgi:uncharacterized protein YecT (DUF1311 family)